MKIIIVGCGRLGSGLATQLEQRGVDVTIIDNNLEAFETLGKGFKGKKIHGIGFDKDVLADAQISKVDGLISCTSSDDTNALIARLAQNVFRVPKVIARLYDRHKADVYQSLGIQTISTTSWGIDKAINLLNYDQLDTLIAIGDNKVEIVRVDAPILLEGKQTNELNIIGVSHVVAIKRGNETFIPTLGTFIKSNDILYISVLSTSRDYLKSILGLA